VASAAEQVFASMLQTGVQHSFEIAPRPVPQMIVASVAIQLPDTAEVLTMALQTDFASAGRIAAAGKQDGEPPASEQERALAAAGEALDAIAGRIKATLETAGARVDTLPVTRQAGAAGDLSEGAEGRMQVTVHTADGATQFVLQLTTAPLAPDATPAVVAPAPASVS
jgi:hypothetical protein